MTDKIRTLHPDPDKQGTNIDLNKYKKIKESITKVLQLKEEVGFSELSRLVEKDLKGKFDGSVSWYVITVKLDLEARGVLEVSRDQSPQKISLSK
jgi:hypothetical protein